MRITTNKIMAGAEANYAYLAQLRDRIMQIDHALNGDSVAATMNEESESAETQVGGFLDNLNEVHRRTDAVLADISRTLAATETRLGLGEIEASNSTSGSISGAKRTLGNAPPRAAEREHPSGDDRR